MPSNPGPAGTHSSSGSSGSSGSGSGGGASAAPRRSMPRRLDGYASLVFTSSIFASLPLCHFASLPLCLFDLCLFASLPLCHFASLPLWIASFVFASLLFAWYVRAPGVCSNTHPEHDPFEATRTQQGRDRQWQQQRQQRQRRRRRRSPPRLIRFCHVVRLCSDSCRVPRCKQRVKRSSLHHLWCANRLLLINITAYNSRSLSVLHDTSARARAQWQHLSCKR